MKEQSHILLVDDEALILESLTNLLEFDYKVHVAVDGYLALELLRKHPIKVIMSDQRMPRMFGHELLREAKKISPNTIRVLLTGYSDLESIMQSVNAGEIFRYINKPWNPDNILNVFKLGVQLHDKLNTLTTQHKNATQSNTAATTASAVAAPKPVQRNLHIEVEEKSGNVLFVGYKPNEVSEFVKQLERRYEVTSVGSVDEAFKQVAKKPVSVIVSDVRFDEIDGVEFLNTIKNEYPNVVTVILTEVMDASLAIRSINELNVFKYLVKPIQRQEFEQVINDAASKSNTYQAAPQTNLHFSSQQIAPVAKAAEDSALRLKLRAAQAALLRGKM
jgi:response regulator RpfG family c-di-GMP phosphodiesterase